MRFVVIAAFASLLSGCSLLKIPVGGFALCVACKQNVTIQSASTPAEQIGAGIGALIAKKFAK